MFFTKSLRIKAIIAALVPTVLVLVVVGAIGFYVYERLARDIVERRDTELAVITAARLSEGLTLHRQILQNLAADNDVQSMELARLRTALEKAQLQLFVFDSVLVYDPQGVAVSSDPFAFERRKTDFPVPSEFEKVRSTLRPHFSDVFKDSHSGQDAILLAVPVVASGAEFKGVVAGISTLSSLLSDATYSAVLGITAGAEGFAYLVDGNGRVISHRDSSQLGRDLSDITPVMRLRRGEADAVITRDSAGEKVISGFAPVPGTSWGVITQEEWGNVVGPIQDYGKLLVVLLALGGVLSGSLIFFAIGRVLKPIKDLTQGAQRIAGGDFGHTIVARTGDEVQALAEQFNTMAQELKESYSGLERKVEERTEELRQSEERYRAVFEQSRDAIFIAQDGIVVDTNQTALDLFGFTQQEAIGSKVGDWYADPADRGRFREEIAKTGSIMDFEVKLLKHDGTVMDCLLTASRQDEVDGTGVRRIQGVVRDITEHKRAEEALGQYAEDLARSNSDLQQFAYVASHDLQEPLRMVSSYTQLLARRYKGRLDSDADEFIGYAVDGATRMQTLINDLLAYSRLGTPVESFEAVDCNGLLDQVMADLRPSIEESDAEISYANLPTVNADRSQLAQVFQNLIGNAIKFSGEEPPLIQVSAGRLGAEWLFSVSDNGIGIEPEYADRIFVIFQRLVTRDQYPGTGIGLAICKKIVENHGGRIWFESQPGKGTTFFFLIPVVEEV